jgi:hypothetical protein
VDAQAAELASPTPVISAAAFIAASEMRSFRRCADWGADLAMRFTSHLSLPSSRSVYFSTRQERD